VYSNVYFYGNDRGEGDHGRTERPGKSAVECWKLGKAIR